MLLLLIHVCLFKVRLSQEAQRWILFCFTPNNNLCSLLGLNSLFIVNVTTETVQINSVICYLFSFAEQVPRLPYYHHCVQQKPDGKSWQENKQLHFGKTRLQSIMPAQMVFKHLLDSLDPSRVVHFSMADPILQPPIYPMTQQMHPVLTQEGLNLNWYLFPSNIFSYTNFVLKYISNVLLHQSFSRCYQKSSGLYTS